MKNKIINQDSQIIAGEVGKSDGVKVEMLGSAVFKDGKMIGKLTGFETQLSLLLRDKTTINSFSINIKDPIEEGYATGHCAT